MLKWLDAWGDVRAPSTPRLAVGITAIDPLPTSGEAETFIVFAKLIWLSPAIGQCNLEVRKIDGGSGCPDPPSSTLSLSYLAIVLVHSKLAKTLSFGVGTNGAASTFDAAALAISVGASDGSRKRCWTATFTARVTTQT